MVTNAACRDKDLAYLSSHISSHPSIDWEVLSDWGLVALQGPLSVSLLTSLLADPASTDLSTLHFGQSRFVTVKLLDGSTPAPILVSRGGYTGEDGFEISLPPSLTHSFTETLLSTAGEDKLRLAGLGARDSLRLEAGMCLYGHDLDDSTTPVEAGLSWVIGKDRRAEGGFHGSEVILKQLKPKKEGGSGVERRRVGLVVEGAPAREGAEIRDAEKGEVVGKVTSGCPSPSTGKNIAMGYVKQGCNKAGTELEVMVRGKGRKATVTKMPFVQTKYWKGAAPA
jgi:aminomethyltransferase